MTNVKTVLLPAEAVRVLPPVTTYVTDTPAEVSAGRALVSANKL